MNASAYEKLTSEIAQSVFKRAEGFPSQNVLVGNLSKWKGKSGFIHQIDVVIQGSSDAIFVECKHWKNKAVKAEHMLTFIARVNDIQPLFEKIIHPVMITSKKFQSGCHKLANHYGIDLEIITSPEEFAFQYKGVRFVGILPKIGKLVFNGDVPKQSKAANTALQPIGFADG